MTTKCVVNSSPSAPPQSKALTCPKVQYQHGRILGTLLVKQKRRREHGGKNVHGMPGDDMSRMLHSFRQMGTGATWLLMGLTLGVTLWFGLQLQALRGEQADAWDKSNRLTALASDIIHLDEVLTMSARMAAANPAMSPTVPPPNAMITLSRPKNAFSIVSIMDTTV